MPGSPFQSQFLRSEPIIGQRRGVRLKFQFEPFKHTQVFPLRRLCIVRRVDRFKTVVMNHMVGWAEVACFEVLDQGDVFSMSRCHSHELATTRAGLPLGNLVSSLSEPGFQHVARGSPHTGLPQSLEVIPCSCQQFNWSNAAVSIWGVVVKPAHVPKAT